MKYNITSNITEYVNCLNSFNCKQFINKPTRIKTGSSSTCIDHVYSNLSPTDIESEILIYDVSDHFPIITKIDYAINRKQKEAMYRRKTSLNDQEWLQFSYELGSLLNNELDAKTTENVDEFAKSITSIYRRLIDKFMPFRKLTRREKGFTDKPWITPELKLCIKRKKKSCKESQQQTIQN